MSKFLIAAALIITGFFVFRDPTLFVDENVHYPVAASFCRLSPVIDPHLTNIPAYHAVLGLTCSLVSMIVPLDSLGGIRFLSLIYSLPVLLFFYLISKNLGLKNPLGFTLLVLFLPISFPFYFLAYTDMMSLAAVLGAYYLYTRRSYALSGLVATLAVSIRQNNIIWLMWIAVLIFYDEFIPGFKLNVKSILGGVYPFFKKVWTFVLGSVAFAGFIVWNGGISLAKAEEWAHPSFSLKLGNIYLFLILLTFFYWPLLLDGFRHLKRLRANRIWLLSLLGSILLISLAFLFTFVNNHPYNQHTFSLHNLLLVRSTADLLSKIITLIPMILGILILFVTPLNSLILYSLYPFTLLFILPSWLIEPRYFIVPFTLLLLLKKPGEARTVTLLVVWQIILAVTLLWGILTKSFFT